MKRLTKKIYTGLNPYHPKSVIKNHVFYTNDTECFQKLGKLEDLEEKVGMSLDEYIKSLEASCERHVEACYRLKKFYDNAIRKIALDNNDGVHTFDYQYEYWHKKMMESEQDENEL